MDMEIIVIVLALAGIIFYVNKKKSTTDSKEKIQNKYAKFSTILDDLKKFKPQKNSKLKDGYTEKSIEKQLYSYFQEKYVSVTCQYGIEGRNARAIDLDIADGVAGIELKIASKIFKSSEFDRLQGQIRAYLKSRYKNNNLILAVCGSKEDSLNTILQDVESLCKELNVEYVYLTI